MLLQIEGTDRVGKTTTSKKLAEYLTTQSIINKIIPFPNRVTEIGKLIDKALKQEKFSWSQATIFQLLQTANRLEFYDEILEWKNAKDRVLIFDRYVLSGVVYGKLDGVPYDFLLELQILLPAPNISVILTADEKSLQRRLAEKQDLEIYEKIDRVLKVQEEYQVVNEDYVKKVKEKYNEEIETWILDNSDGKLLEVVREVGQRVAKIVKG